MAQTYAWVLEQGFTGDAHANEEPARWASQQGRDERRKQSSLMHPAEGDPENLMEIIDSFAIELDGIQRFEETWSAAMQWHIDAERVVQEELRRLRQARMETERCRMAYEKRKAETEAKEQRRRERERERAKASRNEADKRIWREYEARWAAISSATTTSQDQEQFTFHSIPWPMFTTPRTVEDISPARVAMFVLSPLHSEGQSNKERVKSALRRWHPDRFGRLLARIDERDRQSVEEGVGTVARCLSNLLDRED